MSSELRVQNVTAYGGTSLKTRPLATTGTDG
jgi:hypothetical protein